MKGNPHSNDGPRNDGPRRDRPRSEGPSNGGPRNDNTREYKEAISQWQLAARTEVKKSSSLPSSMFDTRDPMLEACLADSVATLMHCLHEPEAAALAESTNHQTDLRVETVTPEELQKLPRSVRTDHNHLDLESGISAEYLSLLIDTCTTGDDATKEAARDLLLRDFAVEAKADLHDATQAVFECLKKVMATDEEGQERIAELCSAIAASVVVDESMVTGAETTGPEHGAS